jgi:hypothetical protein
VWASTFIGIYSRIGETSESKRRCASPWWSEALGRSSLALRATNGTRIGIKNK